MIDWVSSILNTSLGGVLVLVATIITDRLRNSRERRLLKHQESREDSIRLQNLSRTKAEELFEVSSAMLMNIETTMALLRKDINSDEKPFLDRYNEMFRLYIRSSMLLQIYFPKRDTEHEMYAEKVLKWLQPLQDLSDRRKNKANIGMDREEMELAQEIALRSVSISEELASITAEIAAESRIESAHMEP